MTPHSWKEQMRIERDLLAASRREWLLQVVKRGSTLRACAKGLGINSAVLHRALSDAGISIEQPKPAPRPIVRKIPRAAKVAPSKPDLTPLQKMQLDAARANAATREHWRRAGV